MLRVDAVTKRYISKEEAVGRELAAVPEDVQRQIVPPEKIDDVQQQMQAIATRLATIPVPQSEIDRIVGPRIEQTKRDQTSSVGYWMANIAGAQTDPRSLDLLRTQLSDYQTITPVEIMVAAQRWLKLETAWQLRVVPEPKKP